MWDDPRIFHRKAAEHVLKNRGRCISEAAAEHVVLKYDINRVAQTITERYLKVCGEFRRQKSANLSASSTNWRSCLKQNVCIITSVHSAFDHRIFHKEAKTLVKAGYDVSLVAQHDRDEVVDGVKIKALPESRHRLFRMLRTLSVLRQALAEKAKIYHFHDPELIPVGFALKLMTKAKVIYDVHEDYPQLMLFKSWLPKLVRRAASLLMYGMERIVLSYVDTVVTTTEALADRFKREKKTIAVHNYPLVDLFRGESGPGPDQDFDIIHVGTVLESRLSFMLSVGLELKRMGHDFRWCILGIYPKMKLWAEHKLDELDDNLGENFVFIERVPHQDVPNYIRRSRIGINHHPAESRFLRVFPLKIYEYMACGVPVVSSDLPLTRECLAGYNCGILVRPDDETEFARAIMSLLGDTKKAKQMGEAGKRLVEERYNWSLEREKLLRLYQEL